MKQTDKIYYGSLTNLNDTFAIHPVIFCQFQKSEITFEEKFLSLCQYLNHALDFLIVWYNSDSVF